MIHIKTKVDFVILIIEEEKGNFFFNFFLLKETYKISSCAREQHKRHKRSLINVHDYLVTLLI